jgi:hypothetical protein
MAINYKILGQQHPAATTSVDLYTCPTSTQTVVSTISVANVTAVTGKCRVWVAKAGAANAHVYAILYDVSIPGNSINTFTLGLTLAATDVIRVYSTNGADLTFHAYGSEIV